MKKHAKSLREDTLHGNLQFPLAIYTLSDCKCTVPHHWHEEIEILFIPKGDFSLEIDMKKITHSAPAFFFINREQLHCLSIGSNCKEQAIVFHLNMLSFHEFDYIQTTFIKPLTTGSLLFPTYIDASTAPGQELCAPFALVLAAMNQKNSYGYLQVKASLLTIFSILEKYGLFETTTASENVPSSQRLLTIKKVLSFLQEHYSEKLYLRDIAQVVNMDEQYFCRFFGKAIGQTPTEYLNELRIRHAAELLAKTDKKIIEIAISCGFQNMGYFITRFRRQIGCSPSAYRKGFSKEGQNNVTF